MSLTDTVDWSLGAAIVLGVALAAAWRAPLPRPVTTSGTADTLSPARRMLVLLGALLVAGTGIALVTTSSADRAVTAARRTADTERASATGHLLALGAAAWRGADTGTSHRAIRAMLRLDCRTAAMIRADARYRAELERDGAARAMVMGGCDNR